MEVTAVIVSRDQAMPYIAEAAQHDTSGGKVTIGDICNQAVFFALQVDGQTVGAYALKLSHYEAAKVLWVQAAAARLPGVDLSPHILSIIEQQARQLGADQIAFATVRRGAVKKLQRAGYGHESVILRKNLT